MAAVAKWLVGRRTTAAHRDAVACLDRRAGGEFHRYPTGHPQRSVVGDRDGCWQQLLDIVGTIHAIGECARGAVLDHVDHLEAHGGVVRVVDLFPDVGDARSAEARVHADGTIVADRDSGSTQHLGTIRVRAIGNVIGHETLPGVGSVAERLARRLTTSAQQIPLADLKLLGGDPCQGFAVFALNSSPTVERDTAAHY